MAQEDNDEPKVADVEVEKDDDGNYTATVTDEEGNTSEGTSSGGLLSDPSASEAIENAKG